MSLLPSKMQVADDFPMTLGAVVPKRDKLATPVSAPTPPSKPKVHFHCMMASDIKGLGFVAKPHPDGVNTLLEAIRPVEELHGNLYRRNSLFQKLHFQGAQVFPKDQAFNWTSPSGPDVDYFVETKKRIKALLDEDLAKVKEAKSTWASDLIESLYK